MTAWGHKSVDHKRLIPGTPRIYDADPRRWALCSVLQNHDNPDLDLNILTASCYDELNIKVNAHRKAKRYRAFPLA